MTVLHAISFFIFETQVEKRIHQHFAAARTYGKKKEFFAISVMEIDCFYTRLAHELAGCNPNTYQPKTRTGNKRKMHAAQTPTQYGLLARMDREVQDHSNVLKTVQEEQAAQRAMLEFLLAFKK